MAQPSFSSILRWVGKNLTNAQWDTNFQTIVNWFTGGYDAVFGSINATSIVSSGSVTGSAFSGDGSALTNLPTAASASSPYRLVGGLSKSSGYPNFLTVTATDRSVTLSASTTNVFTAIINGTTVSVSTSLVLSGLTVAASANNTCTISTAVLYNGGTWTQTEGEFGDTAINIQSVGSSISALNGGVQGFKVGSTEYFQAFTNTTSSLLQSITRGDTLGGSVRLGISTSAVITLQNINYIFLDSSQTLYNTTTYPQRVPTAPTAVLNAYYFNTSTKKWNFCGDGANWAVTNRILLGRVYCDTTSSRVVQCEDWDTTSWTNFNQTGIEYLSTSAIRVRIGSIDISTTRILGDFSQGTNLVLSTSNIAESVAIVSSNTLYNVYLKNPDATPIFSAYAPRNEYYNGRGQRLHPTDYWRWIGSVYTNSTTQITSFLFDGKNYLYVPNGTTGGADIDNPATYSASTALTTSYVTYEFNDIPPFVKSAIMLYRTDVAGGGQMMQRYRGNAFGMAHSFQTSAAGTNFSHESFIQNSTGDFKQGQATWEVTFVGYHV